MKMKIGHWWGKSDGDNPKYSKKACPTATLTCTNVAWIFPASNPGLRNECGF